MHVPIWVHRFVTVFAASLLVSCSALRPPYTAAVGKLDKEEKGKPATITVGSPQLYARETLINDRMREIRLLEKLVAETEDPAFRDRFKPQLERELASAASLVASLGSSFDPVGGRILRRSERENARNEEAEILRDEIELEKLRQQLVALQTPKKEEAADQSEEGESGAGGDGAGEDAAAAGESPAPSPASTATQFTALDEAKKRLAELSATSLSGVRSTDVAADPIDQFRDLQSYRAVLRQALSAANLDDLHDYDGNALYRLQFQVTVFPGEDPGLLGVVELEAETPTFHEDDLKTLYKSWITHVTRRLNQPLPRGRGTYTDPAYQRLERAGLFTVIQVSVAESCTDRSAPTLKLAVPARATQAVRFVSFKDQSDKPLVYCEGSASLPPEAAQAVVGIDTPYAKRFLERSRQPGSQVTLSEPGITDVEVPDAFKSAIAKQSGSAFEWRGSARGYAVAPTEQVQRISTTSRSASSIETALAFSAASIGDVAGANLGIGYLRSSSGLVEALERSPLVVAFSDQGRPGTTQKPTPPPSFGWVLGPEMRINPDKNRLDYIQRVRSHELLVDLSVPAWWPSVNVAPRTSWRTRWNDLSKVCLASGVCTDTQSGGAVRVPLPITTASMDSLTNVLSKAKLGVIAQMAKIHDVDPYFVSACADSVKLMISGANVWRSTRVVLGGVEAERIEVLPDMEGIAAEFRLEKLFTADNLALEEQSIDQAVGLTVWTRNGSDTSEIRLLGMRRPAKGENRASCSARSVVAPAPADRNPALVAVTPTVIERCARTASLFVKIAHPDSWRIRDQPLDFILGRGHLSFTLNANATVAQSTALTLQFKNGPFTESETATSIALAARLGDDISQIPVRLANCKKEAEKPTAATALIAEPIGSEFVNRGEPGKNIKGEITFKLIQGELPTGKIRIGLLPAKANDGATWVESTDRPAPGGTKGEFKAAFDFAEPPVSNTGIKFEDGIELKVAIVDRSNEVGAPKITEWKQKLKYVAKAKS